METIDQLPRGGASAPRREGTAGFAEGGPETAGTARRKRFIVIRNGLDIIADGEDMDELEEAYAAAVESAAGRADAGLPGARGRGFPPFAALKRCDHEGETGKICILDAQEAADSVKSYYAMGFMG